MARSKGGLVKHGTLRYEKGWKKCQASGTNKTWVLMGGIKEHSSVITDGKRVKRNSRRAEKYLGETGVRRKEIGGN